MAFETRRTLNQHQTSVGRKFILQQKTYSIEGVHVDNYEQQVKKVDYK